MEASNTVIELYINRGARCRDTYAQTAHDEARLFSLSDPNPSICSSGREHVLRDANSVPLLLSKRRGGWHMKERIDVYKGDSVDGNSLAFTIKESSAYTGRNSLHIFLAGSSLDGPPDYKLKVRSLIGSSPLQIFQHERVVAEAKEDFSFCGGCGKNPNFIITIATGVDQAMIVMLVAVYDDLRPQPIS